MTRVAVPSKSDPGAVHVVMIDSANLTATCDCKSWQYRGRCSHVGAALASVPRPLPVLSYAAETAMFCGGAE